MATSMDPEFYQATPESTTGAKEQQSAMKSIESWFNDRGIYGLGEWAWQRLLDGASEPEIYLEVRDQPQYKARFPAMEELTSQGRAWSEDEYISYEKSVVELLKRYNVPAGMYDTPAGMKSLITSNVSAAEVNERLTIAASAAYKAPQEVRNALAANYGVNPNDLIGFLRQGARETKGVVTALGAIRGIVEDKQGVHDAPGWRQKLTVRAPDLNFNKLGHLSPRRTLPRR